MKKTLFLFAFILSSVSPAEDLTRYVMPEMGTINYREPESRHFYISNGNLYPAINMPWGMHAWTPMTRPGSKERWPYDHTDAKFYGILSIRQPSPWIGNYCGWTILPVSGEVAEDVKNRWTFFTHRAEKMMPHYYSVYLYKYDLTLELVPTVRAAQMRVTFAETDTPGFVVDPFEGGTVELSKDNRRVIGKTIHNLNFRCNPKDMKNFFSVEFDRDVVFSKRLKDGSLYVRFAPVADNERINVKIAASFISPEQVGLNMKELGDGDFERLKKEGCDEWNKVLSRVKIESDDFQKKRVFYTCLYRSLLFPRVMWEKNEDGKIVHWSPATGKVHDGYYYAGTGFWDTFRALFPLLNFLYPEENAKMMEGLENCWKESGWLPEWSAPGLSNCMIGNNSASVVADAWLSGVRGNFDIEELYKALLHGANAVHPEIPAVGRLGHEYYNEKGYVPRDVGIKNSASRTLEYAYNDWCIARLAEALKKPTAEVGLYDKRSQNWKNVFDPKEKITAGRNSNGSFPEDFNPFMWAIDFCEGCAHHWTWCVFHDIPGLRSAMGGKKEFERRLDEIFELPPRADLPKGVKREFHEVMEMQVAGMGQYAHGNQPIQHMIYLYAWTDSPWKAGLWAREAMEKLYTPTPDGYCGDEDNGQTSAWYVWSAMGFYPVCPGSGEYALGAPLFDRITLATPAGKTLEITAPGAGSKARRVSKVFLNGKESSPSFVKMKDLHNGGKFSFEFEKQ